jgi:hypothetical protein
MRTRPAIVTAIVAMCLLARLHGQTGGTGRLAGRVVDTGGNVLPGVSVTLAGVDGAQAVTDAGGRFDLSGFVDSEKTYTLTAFLAGFQTRSLNGIRIRPGAVTALGDIVLRIGCLAQIAYVTRGIVDEARDSDLVAHVRVESVAPARQWQGDFGCMTSSEITASVLNSTSATQGEQMRFLPPPGWAAQHEPGDEFVAAFSWDTTAGRYRSAVPQIVVANGIANVDQLSQNTNSLPPRMPVRELLTRIGQSIAK